MISNSVSAALVAAVVSCLIAQSAAPAARHNEVRQATAAVSLITFGQKWDDLVGAASDLTGHVGFAWGDNKPFGTAVSVRMGEYSPAYRTARRHGVTIRKTLDCLIAAPCVRAAAPLLHADADFDRLATCTPLRIYEP